MNAIEKLTKARAGLILDMPFFGALSLRLTLKADNTCKTAWTDGRALGYNEEFINKLTLAETKGLIAHEVMHCAMQHHTRREQREHKRWNKAADYAINEILVSSKVSLPAGALLDHSYDGLSSEAIYSRLADEPTNDPADDGNSSDPGGCGEVRDAKGDDGKPAGEAEMAREAADWKIATQQAATQAKAMGALPGELGRMIEEVVAAKVDWRETLCRFIQQTAKNNYTWSPPNRRHIYNGLYLPSMRSEELPPIVVAVDTSGSIGQVELDQFAAEMTSILQEYNTTCEVVYCDSEIGHTQTFTRDELPLNLEAKGGGGTDFRPPFIYVEEFFYPQPSCLVYLTDMEGRFPDAEPGYPVLWVSTSSIDKAPFGEVVKI